MTNMLLKFVKISQTATNLYRDNVKRQKRQGYNVGLRV